MVNVLLIIFALFIPLPGKTTTWLNFGGGLNFTTIFIVLLAIGAILVRTQTKENIAVKNPLNLPILTFILLTYLSIWSGVFNLGYSPFGPELHAYKRFITTFILYFLVVNIVKDKKVMGLLLGAMILMIAFEAYAALKEHYMNALWHYSDKMRITGTFSHTKGAGSNELGAFFAQYLPILVAFFLVTQKRLKKLIFVGLGIFTFLALMYTYSRGAYLSIVAALFVMGLLKSKKLLLAISIIFILLFSMHLLPVSVAERVGSISTVQADESISRRQTIWKEARIHIGESPLLGHGYDASGYLLPADTHNMYLDIALESGIPAVLVLFWIFIIGFKVAYRLLKNTHEFIYQAIALGFIGCLVALAVGNIFGTRLNFFPINGYFAILMGMMIRASINVDAEHYREETC